MDIDITCSALTRPAQEQLDILGIPYDTGKRTITIPERTQRVEHDYGEDYILPGNITIRLTSNPSTTRVVLPPELLRQQ